MLSFTCLGVRDYFTRLCPAFVAWWEQFQAPSLAPVEADGSLYLTAASSRMGFTYTSVLSSKKHGRHTYGQHYFGSVSSVGELVSSQALSSGWLEFFRDGMEKGQGAWLCWGSFSAVLLVTVFPGFRHDNIPLRSENRMANKCTQFHPFLSFSADIWI